MITPVEIRNQNFGRSIRGFDPDDVKAFLASLSQEWETVLTENKTLKIELEKTKESLNGYREMEAMLHKTLIQAEHSSTLVVENAKREAELKVMEAEQNAAQTLQAANLEAELKLQEAEQRSFAIVNKSYDERSKIEMEIHQLIHRRNEIVNQLQMYLHAQMERIKTFAGDEMIRLAVQPTDEIRQAFEDQKAEHKPAPAVKEPETIVPEPVVLDLQPADNLPKSASAPSSNPGIAYESQSFFERNLVRSADRAGLISAISDDL